MTAAVAKYSAAKRQRNLHNRALSHCKRKRVQSGYAHAMTDDKASGPHISHIHGSQPAYENVLDVGSTGALRPKLLHTDYS